MTETTIPANAEGLPIINRRRLLLGLAAASTFAATAPVEANIATTENPALIALADQFPAISEKYQAARRAYDDAIATIDNSAPLAPDEITFLGTANPHDDPSQPGKTEVLASKPSRYRRGEKYPRRIVLNSGDLNRRAWENKREKRKAKKEGNHADFLRCEEEEKSIKRLRSIVEPYEAAFKQAREQSLSTHGMLYPPLEKARKELGDIITAIMATPDWTMEGVVIKAEVLNGFSCSSDWTGKVLSAEYDWQGQIARSILRHAKGGIQ